MEHISSARRLRDQYLEYLDDLEIPIETENKRYNIMKQMMDKNISLLRVSCSPIMIENLIESIDNQMKVLWGMLEKF
jgi:hypothetical protein